MKSLTDQLANYAAYHRDRRNIATHFVGVPMILFGVIVILSRPILMSHTLVPISPAVIASVLVGLYYLRLDIPLGLLMSLILLAMLKLAAPLAAASTAVWLTWSIGLFVIGWMIQSLGHFWEGRKPAFLDDFVGLIIGPLFMASELVFALGGRSGLLLEIEKRAGKTRVGQKLKTR